MSKPTARRAGQLALPVMEPQADYWRGFLEHRARFELTPGRLKGILTPRCIIVAGQGSVLYERVGSLMTWVSRTYARTWRDCYKMWPKPGAFIFNGSMAWAIADRVFGQLDPRDTQSPLRERLAEIFEWRSARNQYEQLVWVAGQYGMKLERAPRPPAHPRASVPELDRLLD